MSRKLASIVVIEDLKSIKGTDLIEVATLKGWKKGCVKDWLSVIQHVLFLLRRPPTLFC